MIFVGLITLTFASITLGAPRLEKREATGGVNVSEIMKASQQCAVGGIVAGQAIGSIYKGGVDQLGGAAVGAYLSGTACVLGNVYGHIMNKAFGTTIAGIEQIVKSVVPKLQESVNSTVDGFTGLVHDTADSVDLIINGTSEMVGDTIKGIGITAENVVSGAHVVINGTVYSIDHVIEGGKLIINKAVENFNMTIQKTVNEIDEFADGVVDISICRLGNLFALILDKLAGRDSTEEECG